MKTKSNSYLYLLISTSLIYFLALGLFRDYLFVNLNYQISKLYYKNDFNYQLPEALNTLNLFSYEELYWMKFPLTALFSLAYFIPAFFIVKLWFNNSTFNRITLWSYTGLFGFSLLIFAYGYLFNDYNRAYSVSRFFMGILQSPLMLMILLVSFKIYSVKKS